MTGTTNGKPIWNLVKFDTAINVVTLIVAVAGGTAAWTTLKADVKSLDERSTKTEQINEWQTDELARIDRDDTARAQKMYPKFDKLTDELAENTIAVKEVARDVEWIKSYMQTKNP